jgi:CheY-like chemotaxis protein
MFKSVPYDVVLMDVEMPVMDGFAATREIRRIEIEKSVPPTPVLALTAHAFADIEVRGLAAGFTAVLTKPIRNTTLLEALIRHGPAQQFRTAAGQQARAEQMRVEQARNKVMVEEGMEDVVPGYLEKRRADVETYTAALAAADFDSIRKLAHKMKGTGSGYGFPVLTDLGAAIEKAALAQDAPDLREKLEQFASYLKSVELEYIS